MRSRLFSTALRRLASQGSRSSPHSYSGFGGFDRIGYCQTPTGAKWKTITHQRSRIMFPLFWRTFCSTESREAQSRKSLFWTLYNKRNAVGVLDKWLNDGNHLSAYDVQSIVRSIRRQKRYSKALQVSEWMQNNKQFEFTAGDYAIQLDLIYKVHGADKAENYFLDLPEFARNEYTYCTLLCLYVKERLAEKAEQCMEKIKDLGFATSATPYNLMMELYMANDQVQKVISMIKLLKEIDVQPDSRTYTLWISVYDSMSDFENIEKIVNEIKSTGDSNVNWIVYSTLANIYTKAGLIDKAKSALKESEEKVTKTDRKAFEYLVTMYASLGDKEEVHRIWQSIKTNFKKANDQDYKCMLLSLVKVGDIEEAEKVFEEWLSSRSTYDCKVSNILLAAYVKKGMLERAEVFHGRVVEKGVIPNCRAWELLTEGYIESKQMDKAGTSMLKCLSKIKSSQWRPHSQNVMAILKYFEKHGNTEHAEEFWKLLRRIGFVTTEIYNSFLSTYVKAGKAVPKILEYTANDNVKADEETDRLLKSINAKTLG